MEETENYILIRKHLKEKTACSPGEQAKRKNVKGVCDHGSVRDIANWLDHGTRDILIHTPTVSI